MGAGCRRLVGLLAEHRRLASPGLLEICFAAPKMGAVARRGRRRSDVEPTLNSENEMSKQEGRSTLPRVISRA